MQRVRLIDCVLSELPQILGYTRGDLPRISQAVNRADERLTYCEEMNEEGPPGGYAEMAFSVSRKDPFITCPRGVSRLLAIDTCQRPTPLRNQFWEYLEFGTGRMPKQDRWALRCQDWNRSGFQRNNACTFTDISNPPQQIQIFALSAADTVANAQTGAIPRVLLQGLDQNGRIVTSMDGNNLVQGEFVTLQQPYALSVNTYSTLTGIQKDVTQGEVQIFQSDPYWGMAEILLTMEPGETVAWYRRYYIHGLPHHCCPSFRPIIINQQPPTCGCPYEQKEWVMVTALVKLDLIPVVYPTDYTLVQSKEALIAECQSIRLSKMDDPAMRQQGETYHQEAIRILRGQGVHQDGKNNVSANFAPFGNARWNHVRLGMT